MSTPEMFGQEVLPVCPICRSSAVFAHKFDLLSADPNEIEVGMSCIQCGSDWTNYYILDPHQSRIDYNGKEDI